MDWTNEQLLAINEENKNIIVSAGAGSGKTAVLTERVIRKLKSGVDINNLLILTFTNKAALEMKDRIRTSISKDENLKKQLDLIDSSYITTFDSFSLSIVKKYSYLLGISKNITIADQSTIYLKTKEIIDEIFNKLYKEKNESFLNLLNSFTIKNDNDIKKYILNINSALDLKYDKINYLNNYIKNYFNDSYLELLIKDYVQLLKRKIQELRTLLDEISYCTDVDYFSILNESFLPLINSETYTDIKNNLEFKIPSLPRGSEDDAKNIKEEIKKTKEKLVELTRFENENELKSTYLSTTENVKIIIEIIKELDKKLTSFKNENGIYEFVDISKMGITILKNNIAVSNEIKKMFKEIMIDEYQDTSDLQEEFISLIANNNVYMVGDIKQSIYRFRNANPFLFKEKYDNYSVNKGGFKIDLTNNFRSREEVVNNINLIFSLLMSDNLGGANYKKEHQMIYGNMDYINKGKLDKDSNIEIYNYEYDKDLHYSKEEIEIFFIAQDIKNKINNKYQVFDKKEKKLRNVRYSDFTILLDKSSFFDLYKNIFEYFKIPLTKYTTTNIIEEDEILLIKNIIKLILCNKEKKYDVEFNYNYVSIARSYLFEISDDVIFYNITSKKYEEKIMSIVNKLTDKISILSVNEIIYEIIKGFDFYSKIILVGDVRNRINRLTSIISIFNNLSLIDYTIDDVYIYLNELVNDNYRLDIKELDAVSDSVKIMTIHGSKGLEFPICYFASFHSKFNIMDLYDRFMYYNKYGIITPYYKDGIGELFVKELIKDDYLKEEISEKIRLFYVALTRAREKMIIVTSFDTKKVTTLEKSNNFLDMLSYVKNDLNKYVYNIDLNKLNLTKDYDLITEDNFSNNISKTCEKIEIKEINIDNNLISKKKISKESKKLLDKETKEAMKFGTIIHNILELIDFRNCNVEELDIEEKYKSKIRYFISQIDIDKVINIYKEYEFAYEENKINYHGIIDLILEYNDKIRIIDYKLKNIDDESYINQLISYKNYVSKKTNKKIEMFLFSISSMIFKEIKEKM